MKRLRRDGPNLTERWEVYQSPVSHVRDGARIGLPDLELIRFQPRHFIPRWSARTHLAE